MAYGFTIANEVKAALEEAASATGSGEPYRAMLLKTVPGTGPEWDPGPASHIEIEITILDTPSVTRDPDGTQFGRTTLARWDHTIKIAAEGWVQDPAHFAEFNTPNGKVTITPEVTDQVRVRGVDYSVAEVRPLAPGGVVLMWEVRLDR